MLIVRNKWPIIDSLRNKIVASTYQWLKYLGEQLNYPAKARNWDVEEKVYFSFELDDKGYLQNIQLRRDCNPLLAIEVMDKLTKMPRLMDKKGFNPPPRPLEYHLVVSFCIKD